MKLTYRFQPLLLISAVLVISLLCSNAAFAGKSKKWRANNHTNQNVKVYWRAAGCAGIEKHCREKDARGGGKSLDRVCKVKKLKPGESGSYKFDDGTSAREKRVCLPKKNSQGARHHMDETTKRKKNGIRLNANGHAEWFYD